MDEKKVINKLLTERLRPNSLKQMILLPRVREMFENGVNGNVLLYGNAGMGKTTLARILTNGKSCLTFNASDDNGVDVIRTKVIDFLSSYDLISNAKDDTKYVYLEESDKLTVPAQEALKFIIEQYSDSARFIFTCNNPDNLIEPIRSRLVSVPFDPQSMEEKQYLFDKYIERTKLYLTSLNISFEEEILVKFVDERFPDFRKVVKDIQVILDRGSNVLEPIDTDRGFETNDLYDIVFNSSTQDNIKTYQYIVQNYSGDTQGAIKSFASNFADYLILNFPNKSKNLALSIIAIEEYLSKLKDAPDKIVMLCSMIYKLQSIINRV